MKWMMILFLVLVGCKSFPENMIVKEYSLSDQKFEDLLIYPQNDSITTGIIIEIKGEINGKGVIYFIQPPNKGILIKEIEGKFEEIIRDDWYASKCLIRFKPINSTDGKIKIKIKFVIW
jgi:hypothetical protein